MANVTIDPVVLKEKATTIKDAAEKISRLYAEMKQEVGTTASKMKGQTIEAEKKEFDSFQETFNTFDKDVKQLAEELNTIAETFERLDTESALNYGGKPA